MSMRVMAGYIFFQEEEGIPDLTVTAVQTCALQNLIQTLDVICAAVDDVMAWYLLFFFSSRRRHTRFDCDWSSDVCSSDLAAGLRLPRGGSPSSCRRSLECSPDR